MRLKAFKRTVLATALVVPLVVAAVAGQALALQFGAGDLVLALYGNGTEYLQNLGTINSLPSATGTVVNLDSGALTAASGTNTVQWALYGFQGDGTGVGGTVSPLSAFTSTEISQTLVTTMVNIAGNQSGAFGNDGLSMQTLPSTDPKSFTSNFGTSNTLAGAFPVSTGGSLGGMLNLISQAYSGGALTQIGYAVLSSDGQTVTLYSGVAPVPVPAAVVLFGTGLIGLIGVARRSILQQTA